MRLIVLFILLSLGADAQIIRANAFYIPSVAADTLILDSFPAAAGYSVRKLRTAYTGNCMRVRRTRNNTEQDIGFVDNFLDTASLISFADGSNLFVTTWYDQSGNGRDASVVSNAAMPRIYDSVTATIDKRNNKVSLRLDGGDSLRITTGLDIYQDKGYAYGFTIACMTTTANASYVYAASINGSTAIRFGQQWNNVTSRRNNLPMRRLDTDAANILTGSSNYSLTNLQLVTNRMEWANNDGFIYRNGTQVASNTSFGTAGNTSNTVSSNFNLFSISTGQPMTGSCTEIILYNTDESANRTKIEKSINKYYQFYWDGTKQGMLDTYAGAAAAYSLRNLTSTYTGPLIKVRRSSDNIETDIYGDYNGNLDTSELKSFIGANNAFITTWYNQGDSTAVDFTQTTLASQPRIMTSGVIERRAGDPTIRFDNSGTADFMSVASSTVKFNYLHKSGQSAAFITFQPAVNTTNPNAIYVLLNNNNNGTTTSIGYTIGYDDRSASSQNNAIYSAITRGISATYVSFNSPQNFYSADTLALLTNLLDNSTASDSNRNILYRNGTNEQKLNTNTSAASTANASSNIHLAINSNLTTASVLNGYISEIVLYPTDQSSNRTGIETNINNYYGLW